MDSGTVLDASSLIILAKLQEIEALYEVYGPLSITPSVFAEAVERGKQLGKDDALVIEAAIREGWVSIVKLSRPQGRFARELQRTPALGRGESEALAYAKDTQARLIIEERRGRTVARAHGIEYTVLQVFPLEGYILRELPYPRCIDLLERVAVAMNTDLAVLQGIRMAVEAIRSEREK